MVRDSRSQRVGGALGIALAVALMMVFWPGGDTPKSDSPWRGFEEGRWKAPVGERITPEDATPYYEQLMRRHGEAPLATGVGDPPPHGEGAVDPARGFCGGVGRLGLSDKPPAAR
jgi:hypothetical protein